MVIFDWLVGPPQLLRDASNVVDRAPAPHSGAAEPVELQGRSLSKMKRTTTSFALGEMLKDQDSAISKKKTHQQVLLLPRLSDDEDDVDEDLTLAASEKNRKYASGENKPPSPSTTASSAIGRHEDVLEDGKATNTQHFDSTPGHAQASIGPSSTTTKNDKKSRSTAALKQLPKHHKMSESEHLRDTAYWRRVPGAPDLEMCLLEVENTGLTTTGGHTWPIARVLHRFLMTAFDWLGVREHLKTLQQQDMTQRDEHDPVRNTVVVELGSGTGWLALNLSHQLQRVVASREMPFAPGVTYGLKKPDYRIKDPTPEEAQQYWLRRLHKNTMKKHWHVIASEQHGAAFNWLAHNVARHKKHFTHVPRIDLDAYQQGNNKDGGSAEQMFPVGSGSFEDEQEHDLEFQSAPSTPTPLGSDDDGKNTTSDKDASGTLLPIAPWDGILGTMPLDWKEDYDKRIPISKILEDHFEVDKSHSEKFDLLLIGSDLVYNDIGAEWLPKIVSKMLAENYKWDLPGGDPQWNQFVYAHTLHRYSLLDKTFLENCKKNGLQVREVLLPDQVQFDPQHLPYDTYFPKGSWRNLNFHYTSVDQILYYEDFDNYDYVFREQRRVIFLIELAEQPSPVNLDEQCLQHGAEDNSGTTEESDSHYNSYQDGNEQMINEDRDRNHPADDMVTPIWDDEDPE
ncbi:unnamed protein product [Amoebophrya sp. A120]|nr:unnamed protein product [Amoebophrya sp. A120]|eukprot:GSA120T00002108001.1